MQSIIGLIKDRDTVESTEHEYFFTFVNPAAIEPEEYK